MLYFLALLKWIAVVGVLLVGLDYVLIAAGGNVPYVAFGDFQAYNLPVGLFVMVVAVALARWWTITVTRKVVVRDETDPVTGARVRTRSSSIFAAAQPANLSAPDFPEPPGDLS
jgi:hypothetical protein